MLTLILLATTDPAIPTQPGLRPGLTEDQVTPGLLGFIITFGIVVVMFFLIRDMVKRVRRVRYRQQVEEGRVGGSHGPDADHLGIPIRTDDAATAAPAKTPAPAGEPENGAAEGGAENGASAQDSK